MTAIIDKKNANTLSNLLNVYDKVMFLKLFIDSDDVILKNLYYTSAENHNKKLLENISHIDAGFDLFAAGNQRNSSEAEIYENIIRFYGPGWEEAGPVNKLDLRVCCSAKMFTDTGKSYHTGYYMHPRSSLSKTKLRLANSTGIIDAGYRGHLMGMFDVVNISENEPDDRDCDFAGSKYDRYLQLCAPGLVPIIVEIVETFQELGEETERGEGGFGSTGR